MTRIIGGIAGSRKLTSPAKATRPTSDRIRESVFNRLAAFELIEDTRVLDLYAGTGALALEALSRGAKSAVLVEKDGKAAAVCNQNALLIKKALEKEGFFDSLCQVVHKPVASFLKANSDEFDLVFIDPPYDVPNDEVAQNLVDLVPLLSQEATVMLERSSRSQEIVLPDELQLIEQKNYGDTNIFWLKKTK